MTDAEAIRKLEILKGKFGPILRDMPDLCDTAIEAIQNRHIQGQGCPCDLCRYNPPSSRDGKPCGMCPASAVAPEVP